MAAPGSTPSRAIVGFDNDPEAIEVALENAANNGLAEMIDLEVNRLQAYAGARVRPRRRQSDRRRHHPACGRLLPVMPQRVESSSSRVSSANRRKQVPPERFTGLTLADAKPENEWVTLVCQYAD
jgi:hypothetical protein